MGLMASIYHNGRQEASLSDRELTPLPIGSPQSIMGFFSGLPDYAAGYALSHRQQRLAIGEIDGASVLEIVLEDHGTSTQQYEATITAAVSWT